MRLLILLVRNLFTLALVVLGAPFRLVRRGTRPPFIRFRLKGDPPYRKGPLPRWPFGRRQDPSAVSDLDTLRQHWERLGFDPTVKGVVLELEGFAGGPAKRQVIASLIATLRNRGKAVIGYAVSADTAEYELLCACDRIYLAPGGRLELTGFAAEAFALGSGLRKLGVTAQFVRRGEHKTAPELFTHDEVSPIQRQTLEVILDERYRELIRQMATGRGLAEAEAAAKLDRGPFSARRALNEKLVDGLVSKVDLAAELLKDSSVRRKDRGVGSFGAYASTRLVPPFRFRPLRRKPRVSVVPIQGMIVSGAGGSAPFGPAIAGSDAVTRALRSAATDSRSSAVVLYVNSPGGSAVASELILEEVKRTAAKKPVVAYFDKVAASGGYMAALGAKEIWAAPQAIVGSIGVFAGKFDFSGLMQKLGVSTALITRGANAAIFSSARPFLDHERASLEADVEETYQAFLEHVAQARGRTKEQIHEKAEGRIYSGTGALQAGLVDRNGPFEEAARHALELAGTRDRPFDLLMHGPRRRALPWFTLLQRAQEERLFALWYPWWRVEGVDFQGS